MAKLNADGKSYTQPFTVHPDPRGHVGGPPFIER
jgi:hypothetical protein